MRAFHLAALSLMLLAFAPVTHRTQPAESVIYSQTSDSKIHFKGIKRSYSLYKPEGDHDKELFPLVVVLHGGGGKAKAMVRMTNGQFNKIADRDGAYVVYPEAAGRIWEDEGDKWSIDGEDNDLGFILSLITSLKEKHPIDPKQVFVTGMGDGGILAYKLACAAPEKISAIATVTASLPRQLLAKCEIPRGVSLMVMNGTEDPLVPYEGGELHINGFEDSQVLSTPATVNRWLMQNDCATHSRKQMMPDVFRGDATTVTRYIYEDCNTDVRVMLYRIEGGGHTWPGGRPLMQENQVGKTTRDIDGCEEIWRFFQRVSS